MRTGACLRVSAAAAQEPSLLRVGGGAGIYFTTLRALSGAPPGGLERRRGSGSSGGDGAGGSGDAPLPPPHEGVGVGRAFSSAFVARAAATAALSPLTLVKTRLEWGGGEGGGAAWRACVCAGA